MKIENLLVRQLINEFLGTAVLIVVGDSIMAIIIAGGNEPIAAIVGPVGWGVAIFCAVSVAGGVSAHLNPAVTLASASVRKFPLAKVPLYFAAQYMGAFVGAALVFVTYRDLINHFDNGVRQVTGEKGTAGIFATYPKEHVSTLTCFIDQVIATGVMVLTAESIVDERNFGGLPKFLHPTALGLMIMAIIFSFAYNCMCPLNPARDLGPRLFTLMAGWSAETFTLRDWNYVWVPIVGPHIGAILGAWLYKVAISDNWPDVKPRQATSKESPVLDVAVVGKSPSSQTAATSLPSMPPPPQQQPPPPPSQPPAQTSSPHHSAIRQSSSVEAGTPKKTH